MDSIITMGHKLGMKVIAEGVETNEQSALLRWLDCNLVQGYLIGRSLPTAQVEKLLFQGGHCE